MHYLFFSHNHLFLNYSFQDNLLQQLQMEFEVVSFLPQ